MGSNITAATVRNVRLGMTQVEVIGILGDPVRVRDGGPGQIIFDYAIPGWRLSAPEMWVHFADGKVYVLQARQHRWFWADKPVYEISSGHPVFETAEFEQLFARAR